MNNKLIIALLILFLVIGGVIGWLIKPGCNGGGQAAVKTTHDTSYVIKRDTITITAKGKVRTITANLPSPPVESSPGGDSSFFNIFQNGQLFQKEINKKDLKDYVLSKPFIVELDTIAKQDTINFSWAFPSDSLKMTIRTKADTSRVIYDKDVIYIAPLQRQWWDNPYVGGAFGAGLIIAIKIIFK